MSQIRGKEQIMPGTVDLDRLEPGFLKGSTWNVSGGLTGLLDPVNPTDAVNKQALDATVSALSEQIDTVSGTAGVIGAAEDASYEDGLFQDFTPSTPTGHAIDRFNEVLKALAPSAAPALASMSFTQNGATGKLGFGPSSPVDGFANVPGLDINGTYSASGTRKGILSLQAITGALANNVTPGFASNRPYPNSSFGDGNVGSLHLEVNGANVRSVDLANFSSGASVNGSGSGFTLSASSPVQFNDGTQFPQFQYRTGTLSVGVGDIRKGHNTVRVRHEISAGVFRDSQTYDWVVDDNSASTLAYSGEVLDAVTMTGSKFLSGVNYHTGGSAQYDVVIANGYKNSYKTGTPIDLQGTNCVVADLAVPAAGDNSATIALTNLAVAVASGNRLLNGSISVKTSYQRVIGAAALSAGVSIGNLLLDATAASSSNTMENFDDEAYRMRVGFPLGDTSYGSGGPAASAYTWDSSLGLVAGPVAHRSGLLVAGGKLSYPTQTLHVGTVPAGNFAAVVNGPAGNPDYSAAAGLRTFIRYFYDAGARSNFRLNVQAANTAFVPVTTGPSGNNLTLEILAPNTSVNGEGAAEWKDAAVAFSNDVGKGCYASTYGNSIPTNWGCTLGSKNTSTSGRVVAVKITAAAAWAGSIESLGITWL